MTFSGVFRVELERRVRWFKRERKLNMREILFWLTDHVDVVLLYIGIESGE